MTIPMTEEGRRDRLEAVGNPCHEVAYLNQPMKLTVAFGARSVSARRSAEPQFASGVLDFGKESAMRIKPGVALLALAFGPIAATALGAEENRLVHEGIVVAPLDEVWTAFTTKAGQESWMVAHCEIELKIGGRMRTHYDRKGTLGDPKTIENTIICYDPKRLLSIKVTKPPEGFPFPNAVKSMWTIIYFETDSPKTTRVRIVGLGFGDDEESKKMRAFFDRGNAFTLKKLQERFASKKSGQ
jgi:uncharacterized protein YndB with AHSA1/START domain